MFAVLKSCKIVKSPEKLNWKLIIKEMSVNKPTRKEIYFVESQPFGVSFFVILLVSILCGDLLSLYWFNLHIQ